MKLLSTMVNEPSEFYHTNPCCQLYESTSISLLVKINVKHFIAIGFL